MHNISQLIIINSKSLDRHVKVTIVPEITGTNLHWQNKTPFIQDILIPTVTIGQSLDAASIIH